jgi:hypothetical protein
MVSFFSNTISTCPIPSVIPKKSRLSKNAFVNFTSKVCCPNLRPEKGIINELCFNMAKIRGAKLC